MPLLDYTRDGRVRVTAAGYLLPDPCGPDWEVLPDLQYGGWHARPVDHEQTGAAGVRAGTAEQAIQMVIGPPA
jgi:hypothetical protein